MKVRPQVSGILESALYVDDLNRSVTFYQEIFGFEILTRGERICALSVADKHVLLLFKKGGSTKPTTFSGGVIPPTDGDGDLHFALSVTADALEEWKGWLAEKQVAIESTVTWGLGGKSIYFRDPDGHLVELASPGVWEIY